MAVLQRPRRKREHVAFVVGAARGAPRHRVAFVDTQYVAHETPVLFAAVESPLKWVRKAAVFGLGDAGAPSSQTAQAIATRLAEDPSVYVRSVAASALGSLGRRAIAAGVGGNIVSLARGGLAFDPALGGEQAA